MILQRLDTSVDNATHFAGVFPVSPGMHLIPMTDEDSLGNATMTANITNVLRFSDVNLVYMILQGRF